MSHKVHAYNYDDCFDDRTIPGNMWQLSFTVGTVGDGEWASFRFNHGQIADAHGRWSQFNPMSLEDAKKYVHKNVTKAALNDAVVRYMELAKSRQKDIIRKAQDAIESIPSCVENAAAQVASLPLRD